MNPVHYKIDIWLNNQPPTYLPLDIFSNIFPYLCSYDISSFACACENAHNYKKNNFNNLLIKKIEDICITMPSFATSFATAKSELIKYARTPSSLTSLFHNYFNTLEDVIPINELLNTENLELAFAAALFIDRKKKNYDQIKKINKYIFERKYPIFNFIKFFDNDPYNELIAHSVLGYLEVLNIKHVNLEENLIDFLNIFSKIKPTKIICRSIVRILLFPLYKSLKQEEFNALFCGNQEVTMKENGDNQALQAQNNLLFLIQNLYKIFPSGYRFNVKEEYVFDSTEEDAIILKHHLSLWPLLPSRSNPLMSEEEKKNFQQMLNTVPHEGLKRTVLSSVLDPFYREVEYKKGSLKELWDYFDSLESEYKIENLCMKWYIDELVINNNFVKEIKSSKKYARRMVSFIEKEFDYFNKYDFMEDPTIYKCIFKLLSSNKPLIRLIFESITDPLVIAKLNIGLI